MCSSPRTVAAAHRCCSCPFPGRMVTAVPTALQVAVVAGRRASEVMRIALLARVCRRRLLIAAPAPAMGRAAAMVACCPLPAERNPTASRAAGTAARWLWW